MGSGYKPSEADELKKILSLPYTSSSSNGASTSTSQAQPQPQPQPKIEIKPEASTSTEIKPPTSTTEGVPVPIENSENKPLNEGEEVRTCTYDIATLAEHEPRSFPPISTSRKELEEALSKMTLKSSTKISSKRVYSLSMHPSKDKDLVFLGDKEGGVGIWDPNAMAREDETAFIPPTVGYGEPPLETKPLNSSQNKVGSSSQQEGEKLETEEDPTTAASSSTLVDNSNWNENVGKGRSFHLQLHEKKPVTCMRFDPLNPERMYTSSYDATIRSLDFNSTIASNGASSSAETSGYGIQSSEVWLVMIRFYCRFSKSWPLINNRTSLLKLRLMVWERDPFGWEIIEIGGLSVNQAAPHCVAVGSIDQHVRLFDVRALKNVPEYQEPPFNAATIDKDAVLFAQSQAEIANFDTGNAATSVDWSPRGEHLVAVSYDNTIKIWNVHPTWLHRSSTGTSSSAALPVTEIKPEPSRSELEATDKPANGTDPVEETKATSSNAEASTSSAPVDETSRLDSNGSGFGIGMKATSPKDALLTPTVLEHNNKTGKWLTAFRARWHRDPLVEPHFTVGNMDRSAEIFSHDGTLLRSFKHPVFTAVPASTYLHPSRVGRMATGNASGYATFWS
ncbi:hypothetical protein L7F22_039996 [Adiantum nelumboides]|nr:hypothetical protein [Adiantum nelumboides]